MPYQDDPLTDDTTWFLADSRGQKAGPRLVALCREMAATTSTLIANTEKCISVFQWGGDSKDMAPGDHCPVEDNLLTFNAAQNAVETVHSKVVKQRIDLMPLTSGGGYLERHRAKQLGKALQGAFDENGYEVIDEDMVLDALVTDHGAGAVKAIVSGEDIILEHVPIEDVWFDEAEVRYRKPSCCYHVPREGWDKYRAIEAFASANTEGKPGYVGTAESRRRAILAAASKPESWRRKAGPSATHRVDIFEAWHLPSGDVEEVDEEYEDEESGETKTRRVRKHDGRHVVAVEGENGTLIDEPWDGDFFPIVLYTPRRRRRHILGMSLMRDLIAPQREYEKLTKKIQYQHQKMGVSGFAASKQSEVNVREITAGTFGAGFVVEVEGPTPPTPLVVEPVATGTYAYADSIPRNMLERKGISTLAAASQVPAGLSQASGKALQVFEDFEDVRLLPYHRERERTKVAVGWVIIKLAKRMVEQGLRPKSRYQGKHGLESIEWAKVLEDAEDLVLRVFPVSALSKQPAARFAQLTELLNSQAITVEQFKRLFELPDLEAENELDSSDTDVIDRALDIMVTTGRYLPPEPFDNLDLIVQRAGKFYNVCRQHEVPDARLQLIRDYIADAKSLQQQAQEAAAAQAPPAPGAPPMPPDGMMPPDVMPPDGMMPSPDVMPPGMPPMAA